MTLRANPLQPFVEQQGVFLLDGGLATTLEAQGHDLRDPLWSARILLEHPESIETVHGAFLRAGADCLTTSSYQATFEGFARRGVGPDAARAVLLRSVSLATETRRAFLASPDAAGRLRPLVAASVGPYAAFLADGSEYAAEQPADADTLRTFHEQRWRVLASSSADLLACETIPSSTELRVLLELLRATPDVWAWCSVTCRDGEHLQDGTPLVQAFAGCDAIANLAAVGINCTAPRYLLRGIEQLRRATSKPVLVYPNSGEAYDVDGRRWGTAANGAPAGPSWGEAAQRWHAAGAFGVGGCCRVGPQDIAQMRRSLLPHA